MSSALISHFTVSALHAVRHHWLPGQDDVAPVGGNTILWMVSEGEVIIRSGRREWLLTAGDAFLYQFVGGRSVETATGCEWLSIGIAATLFESLDIMPLLPLPAVWRPDAEQRSAIEFYFENCRRVLETEGYPPSHAGNFSNAFQLQYLRRSQLSLLETVALEGAAQSLFVLCWRELNPTTSLEDITLGHFPDWMPRLMMLRQQHPEISVEDLARELGISRRQLVREFRRWFGMPPRQYLNHLRLEEGRQMLLASDASLKTVSLRCGFSSVPHFVRQFSREFGTPPEKYRREYLQLAPI